MRLDKLLQHTSVSIPDGMASMDISGVHDDSRQVGHGDLFVAVRGFSTDGHIYIDQAVARGAAAVLSEERREDVPGILINPEGDNRKVLPGIAAEFYMHPWRSLETYGITGTNGKTSTARMLGWILRKNGRSTGIMGTIGHIVGGREVSAGMTTPGALDTARLMREMVDAGDSCCVMEVSSHALSLDRVESVRFDAAVFTNITQDHLDYHSDMQEYLNCKLHLFDLLKSGGSSLVGTYAEGYPTVPGSVTFGLRSGDDYRVTSMETSLGGIAFRMETGGRSVDVRMGIPGKFNIFNAAGALAAAVERGLDPVDAAVSLADFPGVPGRFQPVQQGQDYLVAVDYAHTPDALRRVLEQASELTEKRVIAVFGAGGDRDSAKRPIMGSIAAGIADRVIVTSDNPRTEDPLQIIEDILRGIPDGAGAGVTVEPDRRKAIRLAVAMARRGDVVIIAGKGHEDYQIIGRERNHFDDREEAAAAIGEVEG